ncbi:MAG TPA: hypothetical protein VMT12_13145 [Syntrophales bacterium]|nr:hypothetical protein [Syntrophales bacterium]
MRKMIMTGLLVCVFTLLFMPPVQAQTPQETLNQYISELQTNPNDYTLREKIIGYVQSMKRAPAIPEEARQHFVEAGVLLKGSTNKEGYELAITEYKQALLIAPWWPDAYYNLSAAFELAGQYDEAVGALKLYLKTNPAGKDAREAQDKIYAIGARKKLAAAKDSSRAVVPEKKRDAFEDLLTKIDGRRYTLSDEGGTGIIDIRGKILTQGQIPSFTGQYVQGNRYEIQGRESSYPVTGYQPFQTKQVEQTFIISEDGNSITNRIRWSNGDFNEHIYLWQR